MRDTGTPAIYTLSLHDALPISSSMRTETATEFQRYCSRPWPAGSPLYPQMFPGFQNWWNPAAMEFWSSRVTQRCLLTRSEEHTSELQSHSDLVCRLLLEKKK